MSGSTRGVRPTDLLALVSFDGRVFRNEAVTWDRLCRAHEPPNAVESGLEGMLSFATGRHTWISVEGQRIRAMVAGRRRGGRSAWEVDTLLATDEEPVVAPGLLLQLAEAARRSGAQRIFLRLAGDSPSLPQALAAGFVGYLSERTFTCTRPPARPRVAAPGGFRARDNGDALALFQLYCETTPESVRAREAATLPQWLALRERDGSRTRQEFVLEWPNGRLMALVRVARDGPSARLTPVLLHPYAASDAEALLLAALRELPGGPAPGPVVVIAPDHVAGVAAALLGLGFIGGPSYVTLVRPLANEARLPRRRLAFVPRRRPTAPARPPPTEAPA